MRQYLEWPLQESDITSELCEKCALCCSNTISFPWDDRKIEWFDSAVEKMDGIEVVGHGSYKFTCSHLKDNKCTIYETRPQLCRDYNCVTWAKVTNDLNVYNQVIEIKNDTRTI